MGFVHYWDGRRWRGDWRLTWCKKMYDYAFFGWVPGAGNNVLVVMAAAFTTGKTSPAARAARCSLTWDMLFTGCLAWEWVRGFVERSAAWPA